MSERADERASPEGVILQINPAARSIALRSWKRVTAAVAVGVVLTMASRFDFPGALLVARWGPLACALVGGLTIGWEFLVWLSRGYVLTTARVISERGVFSRRRVEIPLTKVQQVVVDRTLGERVMGLGTVCVTSAGSQTVNLTWVMIARPDVVAERLMRAADGGRPAMLVLGLAGGIGAGKSAVAAELARRGYVVLDSDKQAKEALDRSDVRAELVKWWGTAVLTGEGRVDRKAVAEIVFKDAKERQRLEALVHPLVRADRATLVDRAKREGAAGVVVDAPLLFEAGADAECDFVLFVDAPLAQRVERVRRTRGWSAAELERREKAQIPLEEKRGRSDEVIVNDGDEAGLAGAVDRALVNLLERPRRAHRPARDKHENPETSAGR